MVTEKDALEIILHPFHLGYAHDENDAHDVRLLCERFGIELPDAYK